MDGTPAGGGALRAYGYALRLCFGSWQSCGHGSLGEGE